MSKTKPTDTDITKAACAWWECFITPERGYEGGWKQRNDMIAARKRKLEDLLRARCGGDRALRPGHPSFKEPHDA